MRMDLVKPRYDTFDELYEYCYKVAGTVGLMTTPVMGIDPSYKARARRAPAALRPGVVCRSQCRLACRPCEAASRARPLWWATHSRWGCGPALSAGQPCEVWCSKAPTALCPFWRY